MGLEQENFLQAVSSAFVAMARSTIGSLHESPSGGRCRCLGLPLLLLENRPSLSLRWMRLNQLVEGRWHSESTESALRKNTLYSSLLEGALGLEAC